MFKFSLRSFFIFVTVLGLAFSLLAHASLMIAIYVTVMTVLVLSGVSLLVLVRRPFRPLLVVATCVVWGYLGIADGGLYPDSERILPTEWGLEEIAIGHVYAGSGLKPPKSLCKSMWRQYGYLVSTADLLASSQAASSNNSNTQTTANPEMQLPKFKFISVPTTTITLRKRSLPPNKPFFVIGHCWFACLAAFIIGYSSLSNNRQGIR